MAFQTWNLLRMVIISAYFAYALGSYDCPTVTDWTGTVTTQGFNCYGLTDECCLSGTDLEYCCDDYIAWSTGAIVGIAIGGVVFVAIIIASIVACCVCCCAAAAPSHHPVHVHTVHLAGPQQPGVVTVNNPPGYYAGAQPPPNKHGKYQQFQNN